MSASSSNVEKRKWILKFISVRVWNVDMAQRERRFYGFVVEMCCDCLQRTMTAECIRVGTREWLALTGWMRSRVYTSRYRQIDWF